jgi:hypothetical protein
VISVGEIWALDAVVEKAPGRTVVVVYFTTLSVSQTI